MNLFNKFCKSFLSCFGCSAKLDGKDKNDFKVVMASADLCFVTNVLSNSELDHNTSNSILESPPPPRSRPESPPLTRENSVDKPANLDLAGGDNVSNSTAQSPPPPESPPPPPPRPRPAPPPPRPRPAPPSQPRENSADNSVNSKFGVVEASDAIEESPKSSLPSPRQSQQKPDQKVHSFGFTISNVENLSTPQSSPTTSTSRPSALTIAQLVAGNGLGSLNDFQKTLFGLQTPATINEVYTTTTNDGVFLLTSQQEIELKIQQRARQIEREQQQINEKCHNLILHFRAEYLIDETRRDYHDRFYRQPNRDSAKDDGIFYIPNGYISVNSDNWRNGGTRDGKPSPTFQSNGGYRSASSNNTLWV